LEPKFTDLEPFQGNKIPTTSQIEYGGKTYGWTVEMQLKLNKKMTTVKKFLCTIETRIGFSSFREQLKDP
jgi:hypothetical protein